MYLRPVYPDLMSDSIGRRNAHCQHIRLAALTQLFVLEQGLSHAERHGDTKVVAGYFKARLGVVLLVETLYPLRQPVHIVCAADEMAHRGVPPVCGIGAVACRKYGCAVFYCHAEDP